MQERHQTPAPPIEAQRQQIMQQVGTAIGQLATHLSSNVQIADAIGTVSARAKEIAFKAWQAIVAGQGEEVRRTVRELAGDLATLAAEMTGLAERAGREAVVSKDTAATLALAAAEFTAIANDPDVLADAGQFRARLRPLAARLDSIPERLLEGKAIAKAFAEGAKEAASLATRSAKLDAVTDPARVLQAVYDGVSGLAAETGKVSAWITANAEQTQRVAAIMKTSIDGLPRAKTEAEQGTGGEQLSAIIQRGAAMVW